MNPMLGVEIASGAHRAFEAGHFGEIGIAARYILERGAHRPFERAVGTALLPQVASVIVWPSQFGKCSSVALIAQSLPYRSDCPDQHAGRHEDC
jgi:hypothetical protein